VRSLKQRAIALLARREHSRAELRRRLASTKSAPAEIDAVLDELEAAGLLSDARFSTALVEQKRGSHGRRAIAQALRDKGVDAERAAEALSTLDGDDELARAQALWARRFGEAPRDDREKARQIRFLLARGYPGSIAFSVVRWAGQRLGASDDASQR
jgi:regulatory protein